MKSKRVGSINRPSLDFLKGIHSSKAEDLIVHENGGYWVCRNESDYTVYKTGSTHSTADSSYPLTSDGLSIAIARCDYLAFRESTNPLPTAIGGNSDPRGPLRTIKAVEETPSATLLTLDCGHVNAHAQHFSYRIGDSCHCFACGQMQ